MFSSWWLKQQLQTQCSTSNASHGIAQPKLLRLAALLGLASGGLASGEHSRDTTPSRLHHLPGQ